MIASKSKESWLLFNDIARSPFLNMAIDQILLDNIAEIGKPVLRFYSWDRPSVSIGYVQKYDAINKTGYTIVRRPTGGGIVFHEEDITYTIVFPKSHWIEKLDRSESYHAIHRVIINALKKLGMTTELVFSGERHPDRTTMQCFTAPVRYDIKLKNSLGLEQKVAGAAQRRTKFGFLHQGSIVIDNIKEQRTLLMDSFLESLKHDLNLGFVDYQLDDNLLDKANDLVDSKYGLDGWNRLR